jgi:hypothetical protein
MERQDLALYASLSKDSKERNYSEPVKDNLPLY